MRVNKSAPEKFPKKCGLMRAKFGMHDFSYAKKPLRPWVGRSVIHLMNKKTSTLIKALVYVMQLKKDVSIRNNEDVSGCVYESPRVS